MRSLFLSLALVFSTIVLFSQQTVKYSISFERAVHHEADIEIIYEGIDPGILRLRMSRSSPGRYAIHEFAKNVYGFQALNGNDKPLEFERPNPHEWIVSGHDGTVKIKYTLFANHADGTYAQIDESHAHLNIPASFVYAPDHSDQPIEIDILTREDLNWKVATQLKPLGENRFYAPHLQYFMDSPIEASDHRIQSFEVESPSGTATINFVLHQEDGYAGFEEYALKAEKIVKEQMQVFGELPDFDFDTYTFLACYAPHVDGDGMEHRNSTVLTSRRSLSEGGQNRNIGTVAHEFFHAWNVERIRPASLEPFDFEDSNISGELWFAEGFTSYYTNLSLCRAGILSMEDYASRLAGVLSYVVNYPGRQHYGPVGMSYQAPFVDAATSVDEVNRENTFISYYSYGNVLGLALDLLLREMDSDKNLDGYMKLVWTRHGKKEIPYTLEDLKSILGEYSTREFAESYFSNYIYDSRLPDFNSLLAAFGIEISVANPERPSLGARIDQKNENWQISTNPVEGSALYKAGFSKGDLVLSINQEPTTGKTSIEASLEQFKPGETIEVGYSRFGKTGMKKVTLGSDRSFKTQLITDIDKKTRARRDAWLIRAKN
jgi:predicted metalloprotease with PDZ domain